MAIRDDVQRIEARLRDEVKKHESTKEKLRLAEEELRHYRTALSAVKWLWEQADKQHPFQM